MIDMRAADMLNDNRLSIDIAAMLVLTIVESGTNACQVFSIPSLSEVYEMCHGM